MKLTNLHEADFARREIQNSRFFSYSPKEAALEADDPEEAPVEPVDPQAPDTTETPEGEPSDLDITGLDDLGADAGVDAGGPALGGAPAPIGQDPMAGMQPEPIPGAEPIQPVEEPQMYGDWQMTDSFDQRDKILEHPSGVKLRIRNLSVHPDRYLAQLYKGKKMIHSGKKDVPDGEDPIQYIIDVAERSLNIEQQDDEDDGQPVDLGQSLNIEQPEINSL